MEKRTEFLIKSSMATLPPTEGILATLLYFKQWSVPVTPADCLRFLPSLLISSTIHQIEALVGQAPLNDHLSRHQGFLVFKGQEESVWHRHAGYNASLTKWRIASQALRWIRWVPFLRLVAVTNTLPMGLAKPESDIDLLVVAKAGRLWLVRFLVTAMIQLLGKRRHGDLIKDRLCLSFYLDDEHLHLQQFFDTPRDLHYAYMVGMTTVIFEARDSGVQKVFEHANAWVKEYFPQHYWTDLIDLYRVHDSAVSLRIRSLLENIFMASMGDALERWLRKFQQQKIRSHTDSRVHEPDQHYVMATDSVIKFHESMAREESRKKWVEECKQFGISV